MALPEEVLVTAMRHHQKYLALETADGRLARASSLVANLPSKDGGQVMVSGNERVLRARLWDAQFFWDKDRKRPLASRVPELDGVVFHASLGSLGAKAARLETLARWMAQWVPGAQTDLAASAGLLCKADLVTGMVGEFPSCRASWAGTTRSTTTASARGRRRDRRALRAAGPERPLPERSGQRRRGARRQARHAGRLLRDRREANRLEGPFALRRAALGAIRLILEIGSGCRRAAFEQALDGYG